MISSLGAASSSSSSSSSSSASVRVEKATSEFLIGPDWTMNIDICDTINSNQWLAKDIVKAVKKRLQHKNPKVQLLSLTLLETMVKNCGDNMHFQIAERSILQDMVKIVKKKTDMHVRDKVLVLLDSWQEAFGGPGGKYPQYYWAYEELRRAGIQFPQRSFDTAPIFTPPVTHPAPRQPQPGYGMPSNSSTRLDEAMAAEVGNLSLSSINSMRDVADLLADMLQAVTPGDRLAVKDEVIVDLVDRCRSNQKKLMQMLTTTGDEELLAQGLELNDNLQTVLAKHDAIASGSPLPNDNHSAREMYHDPPSPKPAEVKPPSPTAADAKPSAPVLAATTGQIDEEEDEEDDFAQLARRHSKTSPAAQTSEGMVSGNSTGEPLDPVASNALVLRDPPATTKEQDIIDLLSLTLSTTSVYPETPQNSASATQNTHQEPHASSTTQGNPYAPQAYLGYQQDQSFSSYVAPWAQPQSQPQPQFHPQYQPQGQPQYHTQFQHPTQAQFQPQPHPQQQPQYQHQGQPQFLPQSQPQPQPQQQSQYQQQGQPQFHPQSQPQPSTQPQLQQPQESSLQSQHTSQPLPQSPLQPEPITQLELHPQSQQRAQTQFPQYSAYPPPPWAATPGYLTNPSPSSRPSYMYSTPQPTKNTSMRPEQNVNPFPTMGSNGLAMNGDPKTTTTTPAAGQKTFIPSYRLFEDLNVFGNGDQRHNSSSGLSGNNSQSMVGGRK
ncbi:TOM1-like protein 6 isoform X1 [Lycium ferocissimum]|uniref:TOM1-like protein 6 isoform X1 n=1 Tax=Lycium ferocissimum TaxID=112874 RepID=UPI0028157735|nr:TOM1-like protein 6 isoform X1 [Lycium ferocissimum]